MNMCQIGTQRAKLKAPAAYCVPKLVSAYYKAYVSDKDYKYQLQSGSILSIPQRYLEEGGRR